MSQMSSLSDEQVSKQLAHMCSFIIREAEEKASETLVKAREQFAREKAQKIREERQKVLKQFEKLQKEVDTKEKIEKSNAINQARLRLLRERETVMAEALQSAVAQLPKLGDVKDPAYKQRLEALVLQGLIKLEENTVVINVRKSDEALVEAVLPLAIKTYTSKTGRAVTATIDKSMYLPPARAEAGEGREFCSGGVVVSAMNGRIVCDNTLDRRLELAYEGLLPQIRGTLFGYSQQRKFFA